MQRYIAVDHYIVTRGKKSQDGLGKEYRELLGIYEELADAKKTVEQYASTVKSADEYLSIAKVNLEECKVHDFPVKELQEISQNVAVEAPKNTFKFPVGPLKNPKGGFPRPLIGPTVDVPDSPFQPMVTTVGSGLFQDVTRKKIRV